MKRSLSRARRAARQPCDERSFGELVAAEALGWIGTPFIWGQSVKGKGCDCKGLVAGVARALGRPEADSVYALAAGYRVDRPVPAALLVEGFAALFDRVPGAIEPGDVLLLRYEGRPGHMAIAVGGGRAVHALPGIRAAVKSRELAVLFHKYPLHSAWRLREINVGSRSPTASLPRSPGNPPC